MFNFNIAEGSGKYDKDERRYFSIARGSALECAAIMDVFEALGADADQAIDPQVRIAYVHAYARLRQRRRKRLPA